MKIEIGEHGEDNRSDIGPNGSIEKKGKIESASKGFKFNGEADSSDHGTEKLELVVDERVKHLQQSKLCQIYGENLSGSVSGSNTCRSCTKGFERQTTKNEGIMEKAMVEDKMKPITRKRPHPGFDKNEEVVKVERIDQRQNEKTSIQKFSSSNGADIMITVRSGATANGFKFLMTRQQVPNRPSNSNPTDPDQPDPTESENSNFTSDGPSPALVLYHAASNLKQERLTELLIAREDAWKEFDVVHLIRNAPTNDLTWLDFQYVMSYLHKSMIKQHNRLTGFKRLPQSVQLALMQERLGVLVCCRQAIKYNPERDLIDISYPGRRYMSTDSFKQISPEFFPVAMRMKRSFPNELRSDAVLMQLLLAIVLYDITNSDRIQSYQAIDNERRLYMDILKDYLKGKLGEYQDQLRYEYFTTWVNCLYLILETSPVIAKYIFDPRTLDLVHMETFIPRFSGCH